jgi:hypothetical protein
MNFPKYINTHTLPPYSVSLENPNTREKVRAQFYNFHNLCTLSTLNLFYILFIYLFGFVLFCFFNPGSSYVSQTGLKLKIHCLPVTDTCTHSESHSLLYKTQHRYLTVSHGENTGLPYQKPWVWVPAPPNSGGWPTGLSSLKEDKVIFGFIWKQAIWATWEHISSI